MTTEPPNRYVVPNVSIPRTLGILNIVFAAIMLSCGLFSVGSMAFMPAIKKAVKTQQEEVQKKIDAQNQAELDALAEREKAAKTEAEKAEAAAERTALAASKKRSMVSATIDLEAMGMADPRFLGYWHADIFTGILLNLAMLISGIGLLLLKPWARTTWLWTAGIKIVRLLVCYGYFAAVLVPPLAQKLGTAVGQMMAQQGAVRGGGGPSVEMLVRIYAITYTVYAIGLIVVGSIYPAISLWLLNKQGAKAAFMAKPKEDRESYLS
jgi:hypothetical protein